MKLFLKLSIAIIAISLISASCKKENAASVNEVSQDILKKIATQGFNIEDVRRINNVYLVEGDILLTDENLNSKSTSPNLLIATSEQYRTTNLVTGLPKTITVSVSGTLVGVAVWSKAVDGAINRYNRLGLSIKFKRVASDGNIDINGFNEGFNGKYITLGFAGFPTNNGAPYNKITLNTNTGAYGVSPNQGFITSVLQHEIGHCIGFRHTDYFNRALSCGGQAANEAGDAIKIWGTPSGFSSESFMLACSSGKDRGFNFNDLIALYYLYF